MIVVDFFSHSYLLYDITYRSVLANLVCFVWNEFAVSKTDAISVDDQNKKSELMLMRRATASV